MPLPTDLLRDFTTRYIWWRDEHPPSEGRVIAQVMNMGTYGGSRQQGGMPRPYELAHCDRPASYSVSSRSSVYAALGARMGSGATFGKSKYVRILLILAASHPPHGLRDRNCR
jgi:hypothetical protein